jgi:hypothetical protein
MITVSQKNMIAFTQVINIVAWVIFVASLPMPMERSSYSGPCPAFGPCGYETVLGNTFFFVLAPLFILTPDWSGHLIEILVYWLIGIGEELVLLAPLLDFLTPFWGRKVGAISSIIFLLFSVAANVAILAYGVDSNLQLGGYGFITDWLLSISSIFPINVDFIMHQVGDAASIFIKLNALTATANPAIREIPDSIGKA